VLESIVHNKKDLFNLSLLILIDHFLLLLTYLYFFITIFFLSLKFFEMEKYTYKIYITIILRYIKY